MRVWLKQCVPVQYELIILWSDYFPLQNRQRDIELNDCFDKKAGQALLYEAKLQLESKLAPSAEVSIATAN